MLIINSRLLLLKRKLTNWIAKLATWISGVLEGLSQVILCFQQKKQYFSNSIRLTKNFQTNVLMYQRAGDQRKKK